MVQPNLNGRNDMKRKPSAFYCGQHDETLEHMVIIEDNEKCECRPRSFDNDFNTGARIPLVHTCFRYFRNVQEAIAFEVGFNERSQ